MKRRMIAVSVLLLAGMGPVLAVCPATKTGTLSLTQIKGLLNGNTACGVHPSGWTTNDSWQEYHTGNTATGNIIALQNGATSAAVGTYSIGNGNGNSPDIVSYTYNGGGTFTYVITDNGTGGTAGSSYTWCQTVGPDAGNSLTIKVNIGQATGAPPPGC